MASILFDIGIIIILATVLAYFARLFRQPLILAYIVAGIVAGPSVLNLITSIDDTYVFAQLGVAFLLFLVGLNLNFKVLKEVGKISLVTGFGQVFFTSVIGYFIGIALGFAPLEALYIGIALTFSSTIIIVKLLSDKNDLDSLYGKISIGFLIVQDFIVIIILIILSGLGTASIEFLLLNNIIKIVLFFGIVLLFSKYVLPFVMNKVASSSELLFLSGISWLLLMSLISIYLGFSVEIGALIAGISLAPLPYHYEISNRIKPLRDFFLIFFFIVIGAQMQFAFVGNIMAPVIIFSLFVLIGNPIIVMVLMGLSGYRKRTSLFSGLTVAQISEFSLIFVSVGFVLGHIGAGIVSMVTLIGIITITVSSYMIMHNERIYNAFSRYISIFERKKLKERMFHARRKRYDIVLIGYHRMGYNILKGLKKKEDVIIVDFNPTIIKTLKSKGLHCIYGDISDVDIIEKLLEYGPKLVVSTIPNFEDNVFVINMFKSKNKKVMLFVTTDNVKKALELYEQGADYVILPYFLGGEKTHALVTEFLNKKISDLHKQRQNHIEQLKDYAKLGQINI